MNAPVPQVKQRLLIVDDEETIRIVLQRTLTAAGYDVVTAANGKEALEKVSANEVGTVILDMIMPGMSGVEVLRELSRRPEICVLMITAIDDTKTAVETMKLGAYDYITKPFNRDEVIFSVSRALEKRRLVLENRAYQQHLEEMVAKRTAELKEAIGKIKLASLDTIHRLARAAEYRDEGTGAHIKRISQYSAAIARKMGLDDKEIETILYAAPMHDVGKIGIPDQILLKPGKLDPGEWETMKKHTRIGAEILQGSDAEFIQLAEVIALTHHEKWDGSGYPDELRGTNIPLAGRIVAIADVFDALISKRPYKEPLPLEKSLGIIREGRGSHFDPDVVDAFFAIRDKILSAKERYKDERESQLTTTVMSQL